MDEVVAVSVGQHQRLAGVLEYALTAAPHTVCTLDTLPPPDGAAGALLPSPWVPTDWTRTFCHLLRLLRSGALSLDGSMGAVLMDGEGEFYTKQAAQMLVLAANGAGCLFPGKPLVEATGSLRNFDIQCRRRGTDRLHAYRAMARELVERLASFVPPVYDRPKVLTLHASDRKTSNTLALGGEIETRLVSRCDLYGAVSAQRHGPRLPGLFLHGVFPLRPAKFLFLRRQYGGSGVSGGDGVQRAVAAVSQLQRFRQRQYYGVYQPADQFAAVSSAAPYLPLGGGGVGIQRRRSGGPAGFGGAVSQ